MNRMAAGSSRGTIVLAVGVALLFGATIGLGAFTFGYADGSSYFSNNAEACANCHVMRGHLDAWTKSSHRAFASCNDCHAPHAKFSKLYSKARNGFSHSLAFTTGEFPDNLHITDFNRGVTEAACRDCHTNMIDQIDLHAGLNAGSEPVSCIRCHENVGHDF